jgi:hypothetical protein
VELSRKTAGGTPLQGYPAGCVHTPASRPDPLARGMARSLGPKPKFVWSSKQNPPRNATGENVELETKINT